MTSEEKNRYQLHEKGCKVNTKIVQHRLFTEFGVKLHKLAQKQRHTENMKKKRLSFAKAHAHWTIDLSNP